MPVGTPWELTCGGAVISALLTAGCAAQVAQSWVGRPIDSAVARYGPPAEVAEVGGGRKAYRWRIERGEDLRVNVQGMSTDHGSVPIWAQGSTIATSGRSVDHCVLTLTAKWDGEAGKWTIVDADGPRCP